MRNRTTTWKMAEYTDDTKMENFRRMLEVIDHFAKGKRITEDWMEEHKKVILTIRGYFTDVNLVNLEITDREFRKLADDSEMLLAHLAYEIQTEKTFTPTLYLNLNRNLKRLHEIALQVDELADLLNGSLKF